MCDYAFLTTKMGSCGTTTRFGDLDAAKEEGGRAKTNGMSRAGSVMLRNVPPTLRAADPETVGGLPHLAPSGLKR